MSSYLPYGGFKWLKNVDNFDVNSISKCNSIENNSTEYILKVSLEYPDELHTLHNDYPLALEKLSVPYDRLLDYCKKIRWENYVLHYRNLQLYLSLRMKLIKILRVPKFKQSD